MLVCSHQLLVIGSCNELHVRLIYRLVLVLEVHHVRLMHAHFPIWRETLALICDIGSHVVSIGADWKLPSRALLAQPLACICMCRRLSCFGLQGADSLMYRWYLIVVLALWTSFASL